MSKPVHPTQIRPTRQERRRKQRDLREEQKRQGRQYPPTFTLPNHGAPVKHHTVYHPGNTHHGHLY